MKRELTRAEVDALEALMHGNVQPLSKVIAELLTEEQSDLHPLLLQKLYFMLEGTASETDWRLVAKRHPDLKRGQSSREQASEAMKELGTAIEMVRNGVLSEGGFDAAVNATAKNLGIGESTVERHWRNKRSHILNDIRWGIISADLIPGPIADRHNVVPGSMTKHMQPSSAIKGDKGRD
ncbi:hypothetical protein [Erythrobacter alti]|uniref:hypothetical protein n=1 Tax=Erythrobacter alti TaxID=1896145 RepID=UPI0030F442C9